jgi:hypothetical protein
VSEKFRNVFISSLLRTSFEFGHEIRVSFFTLIYIPNIFLSGKHLASHDRDTSRNASGASCNVIVEVVRYQLKLK